jgi:hypothetical protein
MKTTRTLAAILSVLLAVTALSPLAALDLTSAGITVLSSQPDGARTVYELEDSQGRTITVIADKEVTDEQAKAVLYLRDTLTGWKSVTAASLRVTLSGDKAEALVVPTSYSYDGMELTKLIPSGMQFYMDTILEYDFRMRVGSIFLRMKGQFFDEDQLGVRVVEAARDPIRFLERTDPEYLYRTLQEVTTALKGLESGGGNALQSLRDLIADYQALKAQKPLLEKKLGELDAGTAALTADLGKLASDYSALKEQEDALAASHQDLARRHDELETAGKAEAAKLEAAITALEAANKELAASTAAAAASAAQATATEIARLRTSMLTLHNTGFLRGPTPMDPKLVARTVELKRANAAMTSTDIVTALKADGITATKKQVDLILLVYFPAGS